MSDGFYAERMESLGIDILTPTEQQKAEIHRIIFEELTLNQIKPDSLAFYQNTIKDLQARGAQGVILGCTEICLLINEANSVLPVFDSTQIHALAAVDFMLSNA